MAVKWGIISTADINRQAARRAPSHRTRSSCRRGRQPRPRAGADVRLAVGDRAGIRIVRRAARRPRRRGGLHPAPEHAALRVVDPRPRGGQARACEKPFSRHPADVERGIRRGRAPGKLSLRGVHVPPPPADGASAELVEDGRDRRTAGDPLGLQLLALDTDNIRLRTDVEGGALMDVGCYCVSGARLLGGEPDSVYGQQFIGPIGHRLGVRRDDALPGRRDRDSSTAARRCPTGTSSRRSGRRARSSSTTPGTASRP